MTTINDMIQSYITECENDGIAVPERLEMNLGGHRMFVDTRTFKKRKQARPRPGSMFEWVKHDVRRL